LEDRGLKRASAALKETLYRTRELELFRCISQKLESKAGESRTDFIVRLQDSLNTAKEEEIEKLQERYSSKEKMLLDRLSRAKAQVEKESADSQNSIIETGIAILGALFGKTTPSQIGTAVRKGSQVLKERSDMSRAEERVADLETSLEALEYELEDKIDLLDEKYRIENCEIERIGIRPRKSDIVIESCAIVWKVDNE
jgi:hypothetical protein